MPAASDIPTLLGLDVWEGKGLGIELREDGLFLFAKLGDVHFEAADIEAHVFEKAT